MCNGEWDGNTAGNREEDWVRRARSGDREAFGELVRLHRARAFGWARSMAGDPHLAEDVVQDALMRAFLRMGTLLDESRFVPWLKKIVHNEARMKLRRGGPHGREHPFSGMKIEGNTHGLDPSDLEDVINWLSLRRDRDEPGMDPEVAILQRENLEMIRVVLRCLNRRERALFEAYFFKQLSPGEIAELLSMSRGHVYTSLHRVKEKVRREGFRLEIRPYLQIRKEQGLMSKKRLHPPQPGGSWNSFVGALREALGYTEGKSYSLIDLMGYTGQAFRIQVHPEDVDVAGPTAYLWKRVMEKGLANIGVQMGYCGSEIPNYEPPSAQETMDAIRMIHRSVDRGVPVIGWDLFISEFGLIYGYDDEKEVLDAVDLEARRGLPYDRLGRGKLKELALVTIDSRERVEPKAALRGALQMALEHGEGKEPAMPGYVQGTAAYASWAEAFKSGSVDPFGNAYNAAVYSDARQFATHFLLMWSSTCPERQANPQEQLLLARAAACYAQVGEALTELRTLFPFPSGGDPADPGKAQAAVKLLEKAKEAETEGLHLLEELSGNLVEEGNIK
ncbi:sigma-70 family RNA polymerase sigma factor [Kroppenstedtia pulmonis]|uniref:RNA polymerase sigma factor n=1 Tax=Kroppenstedtia pulmonis TaxID=1380685 RepID=A0A7D4BP79_9BACL|nr:sigma-70 family RNA polymerase sigma factor [Kroppenstedtia pulmonis]QKG83831.1 sigma-70 family RNA polymerase sigma factor [Kroppenstedtia pulmonis]